MVSKTVSTVRDHNGGRGRGCGRGGHDSPPLTHAESPVQEENREGSHREEYVESEGTNLRQMMMTIMGHLPPPRGADQEGSHHAWNKERWRSKSPQRDLHGDRERSTKVTQMKDLQRSKIEPFTRVGKGYVVEQWLIALDRCFMMHEFDSNVKARLDIIHLELFGAT